LHQRARLCVNQVEMLFGALHGGGRLEGAVHPQTLCQPTINRENVTPKHTKHQFTRPLPSNSDHKRMHIHIQAIPTHPSQ
jgi:hypothetical protein